MKEHQIFFNTEMVQAILEGRKTQTRRIIKPQPQLINGHDFEWKDFCYSGSSETGGGSFILNCPFGQPGDRLWVRETWMNAPNYPELPEKYYFKASKSDQFLEEWKGSWKPSIHMPKIAALIWLEIEEVKVERLQDISEEDAKAEGVYIHPVYPSPRMEYANLWDKINPKHNWEANPWVWVIKFKVLSTTGTSNIPAFTHSRIIAFTH